MESQPAWRRLFSELRRRKVWRVAAVYATTAFVLVQVADLSFVRLGLPPWTVTLVLVFALVGFPLAVVLAWAFEVTPEGVRRTESTGTSGTVLAFAAGVTLLVAGGWWLAGSGGGTAASIDRLAVLPLVNLMDDPDQAYFVQGMHDRLISELQEAGVSVIARTSVMRFSDGETPAREIARELDVDALVEGTVFRAGDSVAIEARLVDPGTEEYLWRRSFGGSLRNVVALHRNLTRAIAGEIRGALAPEVEARLAEPTPVDPEAYDAYLRGVFHAQRFTPEDLDRALEYFETSLSVDSTYAPAYVGIARVWIFRATATVLTGVTAGEARQEAKPALERALALDSTLAEAHLARGWLKWGNEWEFEEGAASLRRAIDLNPGLAEARIFYAHLLTILGDWEEARRQAERAVQLDPLNPFIQGLYGVHLVLTRRHEEAIEVLEEMFRRNPGAGFGRAALVDAYEQVGRHEEALRLRAEMARARGESEVAAVLERGYREGGYREALRRAADTMAARARAGERGQAGIGVHYASAGEGDEALEWLEKEIEARNQNMPYIGVTPNLEFLHDDHRFRALVERVGVPLVTEATAG